VGPSGRSQGWSLSMPTSSCDLSLSHILPPWCCQRDAVGVGMGVIVTAGVCCLLSTSKTVNQINPFVSICPQAFCSIPCPIPVLPDKAMPHVGLTGGGLANRTVAAREAEKPSALSLGRQDSQRWGRGGRLPEHK
jgi:hypothetical protein